MLATAFLAVVGASPAHADDTSDNYGVANGSQVTAPVSLATVACGISVAGVGKAFSGCDGEAMADSASGSDNSTYDNYGVANGSQITAPIASAANICGSAISVIAKAMAGCVGMAGATADSSGSASTTSDNYGLGNGTQGNIPVAAATNVCGVAAAVLGKAVAGCEGISSAAAAAQSAGDTYDTQGVAGGSEVVSPNGEAAAACGNAVGNGAAGCAGGAGAQAGDTAGAAPVQGLPDLPASLPVGSPNLPAVPAGPAMPAIPAVPAVPGGLPALPAGMPALPGGLPLQALPAAGELLAGLPFGALPGL